MLYDWWAVVVFLHIHDISSVSVRISLVLLVVHVGRFYYTCYINVSGHNSVVLHVGHGGRFCCT